MSYTDPTKITILTCPFVSSSEAIQLISKSLNIHLQPPQRGLPLMTPNLLPLSSPKNENVDF
jgi:hypothetical protein